MPLLGDVLPIIRMNLADRTKFPLPIYIKEKLKDEAPPINGIYFLHMPMIYINSPELLEEAYITNNKYFDKHPHGAN